MKIILDNVFSISACSGRNFLKIGTVTMKIIAVKNEHNAIVYHVKDDGCIQEFWSYKEAKAYVAYVKEISEE